jgi:hypothetical protein
MGPMNIPSRTFSGIINNCSNELSPLKNPWRALLRILACCNMCHIFPKIIGGEAMFNLQRLSSRRCSMPRAVVVNSSLRQHPLMYQCRTLAFAEPPRNSKKEDSEKPPSFFANAFKNPVFEKATEASAKAAEALSSTTGKATQAFSQTSAKATEAFSQTAGKATEAFSETSSKASEAFSQAKEKVFGKEEEKKVEAEAAPESPSRAAALKSTLASAVDVTKTFTSEIIQDVHGFINPEVRREQKRKELEKKRTPLYTEGDELPEGEEYSARTELMVQEAEKTSWEKAHEKIADTKAYKAAEEVVNKFKKTSIYEKSKELKNKVTEKREDFDEYLETTQNPVVIRARETLDAVMEPTDSAVAMDELYARDPDFSLIEFLEEMEHDVIPEFVHAWLSADTPFIEDLCEADALRTARGEFIARQTLGHYYDTTVMGIDNVSVRSFHLPEKF